MAQSASQVVVNSFYSDVLGVPKQYAIYLPQGYDEGSALYPVVYFLRLHEREWFDTGIPERNGIGLKEVADALIAQGLIGEMILVGPSTGSDDGSVAGMVNMLQPDLTKATGIGSGRFEDYFVEDLVPEIENQYRTLTSSAFRGVDGFSFGGYTALVLTFRNPGLFSSVGSYDGTHMWYNLEDPAVAEVGPNDPFWLNNTYDELVGPLFGVPRDVGYMLKHNAINLLLAADAAKLDSLRAIRFHIHTGDDDGLTNMRRTNQLVDSMAVRGIVNSFPSTVLFPGARHDYSFANFHATRSLVAHWETFQLNQPVAATRDPIPNEDQLYTAPNPFVEETTIHYAIQQPTQAELEIYDMAGRKVRRLVSRFHAAGMHEVVWDANDAAGTRVAAGVYWGALRTDTSVQVLSLMVAR
ncbi:MAG: alpha/beta hydrolase-fold protein [Bacteroidota bacterium]